jgi:hypothetical protein
LPQSYFALSAWQACFGNLFLPVQAEYRRRFCIMGVNGANLSRHVRYFAHLTGSFHEPAADIHHPLRRTLAGVGNPAKLA